jgi:hypothetical protein
MNINTCRISWLPRIAYTDADLWNIYIFKSIINPSNIAHTTINPLFILDRSKET